MAVPKYTCEQFWLMWVRFCGCVNDVWFGALWRTLLTHFRGAKGDDVERKATFFGIFSFAERLTFLVFNTVAFQQGEEFFLVRAPTMVFAPDCGRYFTASRRDARLGSVSFNPALKRRATIILSLRDDAEMLGEFRYGVLRWCVLSRHHLFATWREVAPFSTAW